MSVAIRPAESPAPNHIFFGKKSKILAINSKTPIPILPQGSIPTCVKM